MVKIYRQLSLHVKFMRDKHSYIHCTSPKSSYNVGDIENLNVIRVISEHRGGELLAETSEKKIKPVI